MRDIAKVAGVHFTTVSLALRNSPRLPHETCEQLQRVAREMGYVPDPMLSSLAVYRNSLKPIDYHATLAWVTAFPNRDQWRDVPVFLEQFQGASARAEELGFRLEQFWLTEPGMTSTRATQILRARGISGLIIAPLPKAGGTLKLDWQQFSSVAIGYSLIAPSLHLACAHQYRCIRLALHELRLRGYRRIGLVVLRSSDDRVDHNWLAGYLIEQFEMPKATRLSPLVLASWEDDVFGAWVRKQRPDAIISKLPETVTALRARGLAVPDDIAVAYLSDTHPGDEHSGVDENSGRVGAAAVDFVVGMLHRNERGVPEFAHRLLIEGRWVEGATVRPRPTGIFAGSG